MSHDPSVSAVTPAPFQAAIIDLDGTMIDTLGDFGGGPQPGAGRAGPAARIACRCGAHGGQGVGKHLVRSTLAHVSPADAAGVEALFPAAMAAYQRHYLRINGQHSRVYDGVVEGLTALQAMGLKLASPDEQAHGFCPPAIGAERAGRVF